MTCIDCCYCLLKDGIINCTYEEGNCIVTDRIKRLEDENLKLKEKLTKAAKLLKWALHSDPKHDDLVDFDTKWNECKQLLEEAGEMNNFAFKCTNCGTIDYSNTLRRVSMRCPKCGKFNMVRSAKDDRCSCPEKRKLVDD